MRTVVAAVSLCFLLGLGRAGAAASASATLSDQLRSLSPDSASVWEAAARENGPAFRAAVESLLVTEDLRDPLASARLGAAGEAYLAATRDSVLLSDRVFLEKASPSVRDQWFRAAELDRRGGQLTTKDPKAAADLLLKAIRIYAEIGQLRRQAVAWGSLGTVYFNTGWDRPRAGDCYRKALVLRERLGDPLWIGRALNTLGSVQFSASEYDSALYYYERARAIREKLGDANDLALTLAYIGNVYKEQAEFLKARESYRTSLATAASGSSTGATIAREGLANVSTELGDLTEASALYHEVLAIKEQKGLTKDAASTRGNLAVVLWRLGDYAGALTEMDQALEVLEESGDKYVLAGTLNQGARIEAGTGNFPRAIELSKNALQEARASRNTGQEVRALMNLGYVYNELGSSESSLESLHRAKALADSLQDAALGRDILSKSATVHEALGEHAQALELHDQALTLDRAAGNPENIALDLMNLGSDKLTLGRRDEGLRDLRAAARLARDLRAPEVLWNAELNIADAFETAGDLDSARVYNARAIETMESVRVGSLPEEAKAEFMGKRSFVYEAQVQVLAKLHALNPGGGFEESAWKVAERGKARALNDILEAARIDLHEGTDPELLREEAEQGRALNAVGYKLRRAEETGASEDSLRTLREERDARETGLKRVEDRLWLYSPKLAAMDPARGIDLAELRSTLLGQDGALLLEYVLGDSGSYLWAVTKQSVAMYPLPGKEAIQNEAHRLRRVLEEDGSRTRGRAPAGAEPAQETWQVAAGTLHDMVLSPVGGDLARARDVIVIPDGALQYVPFELLLEARTPGFLGKKSLRYGPSAAVLAQLEADAPKTKRKAEPLFLGVGDPQFKPEREDSLGARDTAAADSALSPVVRGMRGARFSLPPLPYTRKEVESVGGLFGSGHARILLGEEAQESALVEPGFLSRFQILHFATHGLTDERFPMRSALALAFPEDPSQDGFLTAAEIYRLRLDADLVVLSACETGKGKMVRGEGVLGLPRAFLYAGARNVVVSLWSVSDEATAVLMRNFYAEMIGRKRGPAEALARAKTAMIESKEWNHPFYWAGFVLLGPG